MKPELATAAVLEVHRAIPALGARAGDCIVIEPGETPEVVLRRPIKPESLRDVEVALRNGRVTLTYVEGSWSVVQWLVGRVAQIGARLRLAT